MFDHGGMDASNEIARREAAQSLSLPPGGEATEGSRQKRQRRAFPGRRALALLALGAFLALATCYHYLVYLPQPDRPHVLTLLDDVFALGVIGIFGWAGLAVGMRLLRPFRLVDFSRIERGALALGLGWGIFSLGMLALGVAHLLYLWALLAALGLALALCWREARQIVTHITRPGAARFILSLLPRTLLTKILSIVLLLQLALLGLQALAPPSLPYGYDVYLYHWAVPRLYLLHHTVLVWPGWAAADFPYNNEMLVTFALAFGSEAAATWIQIVFGILILILLIAPLARRFGGTAAWLGAALCLTSPIFTTLLVSGYNELAMTYYGLA